jgi:thiol-disulfide isomerase/thioredoxin
VAWFVISAFRTPPVEKTGLEGRLIPSITLQLTDSTTWLKTDDIPNGKPFIVMGFSPWCIHCQALTVDIKQHRNEFKDIPIYYITPDRFKNMRTFYKFYKLSEFPNIKMGRDSANTFFKFFNAKSTPLIAIYDAKKRLKRVITGQPKALDLAKSLQD